VDNAAADPAFTGNFIRSGQAGLFAVRTAEIEQNRESVLAAATDGHCVPAMTELFRNKVLDRAAIRADKRCRVVSPDVGRNSLHRR
jgi:hypothetical protein